MSDRRHLLTKKSTTVFLSFIISLFIGTVSYADPVTHTMTVGNTDWTSAGVAGIGSVGTGTITLSGISGTVDNASLYWHGIGNPSYDSATVSIDGNAVVGTVIGTASTNCWGAGSSVAYRADVSAFVSGDGAYAITGLEGASGNSGNGASIVVTYDDGNPTNNRDIAFFEGNDSDDIGGFPGEDTGWHTTLTPIEYDGVGTVTIQFHAADGQPAGDGPVTLTTANGSVTIPDTTSLWDGVSVPDEGNGRNSLGLWDIHDFDITAAFGSVAGSGISLDLDGQDSGSDCLGLVLAIIDFPPGSIEPLEPQEPVDVPTLSNWSVLLLIAMILLMGVFAHRRSRA